MNMELLKAAHFTSGKELAAFVNNHQIARENILTIVRGQAQDYTLFYY